MNLLIPTVAGVFNAEFRDGKLAALSFPPGSRSDKPNVGGASARRPAWNQHAARGVGALRRLPHWPQPCPPESRNLRAQLDAYVRGRRDSFSVALDLTSGTAFQRKVWRALQRIPYGATKSYSEIARAIGSPRAARAVGTACGKNPIPVLVPCHRVVAHGGKLGGFSGGLHWKKRLLALEANA